MTDRRKRSDRTLGMDRPIDRRDFLNGVAVAIGAIGAGGLAGVAEAADPASPWPQDQPGYDPPVLNGMRGSHHGSFENAHALRDGDFWSKDLAKVDTGERYTPDPPADMAGFVRPHMEAVFPQTRGVGIDYAWGGLVSVTMTRLPHIGREGEVLFAHGYSGMGVILSTLAGKLLIEAIGGGTARFDQFAALEPAAFPGGVALRGPLHVLGMLWYALRDRVG